MAHDMPALVAAPTSVGISFVHDAAYGVFRDELHAIQLALVQLDRAHAVDRGASHDEARTRRLKRLAGALAGARRMLKEAKAMTSDASKETAVDRVHRRRYEDEDDRKDEHEDAAKRRAAEAGQAWRRNEIRRMPAPRTATEALKQLKILLAEVEFMSGEVVVAAYEMPLASSDDKYDPFLGHRINHLKFVNERLEELLHLMGFHAARQELPAPIQPAPFVVMQGRAAQVQRAPMVSSRRRILERLTPSRWRRPALAGAGASPSNERLVRPGA